MNEAAWRHGNLLQVGDVHYRVVRNPPTVDKVKAVIPGALQG